MLYCNTRQVFLLLLSLISTSKLVKANKYKTIYDSFKNIANRCPGDVCHHKDYLYIEEKNCFCSSDCQLYTDCCKDVAQKFTTNIEFKCHKMNQFTNAAYYMRCMCNKTWKGNRNIIKKCESHMGTPDPIKMLPVTDIKQNITYKNIYCAWCNNVANRNIHFWDITINCQPWEKFSNKVTNTTKNTLEKEVRQNLYYDAKFHTWKSYITVNNNNISLHCNAKIKPGLKLNPRQCKPHINTCASNWNDSTIAQMCSSFNVAYRYLYDIYNIKVNTYKNAYCAICNNVHEENLSCEDRPIQFSANTDISNFSFGILLNFNSPDYNHFGNLAVDCPEGNIYDQMRRQCQQITCGKYAYYTNGQCLPLD